MKILKVIGLACTSPTVRKGLSILTRKTEINGALFGFKVGLAVGAAATLATVAGTYAVATYVQDRCLCGECHCGCDDGEEQE